MIDISEEVRQLEEINIEIKRNKEKSGANATILLSKGPETITLRIDDGKGEVSVEATTRSGGQMIGTFKFKDDEVEWRAT